jgi:cytochrome c oxidase subunit 2
MNLAILIGEHAALSPAGTHAGRIASLYWVFFWISAIVWFLVVGFAFVAAFRRGFRNEEQELKRVVISATGVTAGVLVCLLIASLLTDKRVAASPYGQPLDVEVVGHQWWWEVHYPDTIASRTAITANEIHIPVGRSIHILLSSHDVIHSFWAPSLQGKVDLIPTRVNDIWISAERPGIFRGQCAEYCGVQHAKMGLYVIAEPPSQFERWREHQLAPAAEPVTDSQRHGREVFLNGPCLVCHALRGTSAFATLGPDLTHVASRGSIAAAVLANNRGNLGGWIVDAQHIKPGAYMPSLNLKASDVQPLVDYLEMLR